MWFTKKIHVSDRVSSCVLSYIAPSNLRIHPETPWTRLWGRCQCTFGQPFSCDSHAAIHIRQILYIIQLIKSLGCGLNVQGTGEEPELCQQAAKKDPRRRSFTGDAQSPDDNMQGVWKEIYTDTQSTAEQQQQQQLFMPFSPGQFLHTSKANPSASPTQQTLRPPGAHHTPGGVNGSTVSDVDLNSQSSTDVLVPPGKFSASPRSKYLIPVSSPDNSFVGKYMKRSNAPASPSYAAMSPRTNPTGERQPKLTQVNFMSPTQSERGILTPTMSQAALSPDLSKGGGYLFDRPLSPARMLPPAMTRSPPHMEMLSPSASVKSSKPVVKASRRKVEQSNINNNSNNNNASPRGSVSRERSPWKVFKESLHAMSPAVSTKDESHIRGFAKDQLNSSFQGSGRRPMAAASSNTASVGWAGCKGGMSTVAMDIERNASGTTIWNLDMCSNLMHELLNKSIANTTYSTPIYSHQTALVNQCLLNTGFQF